MNNSYAKLLHGGVSNLNIEEQLLLEKTRRELIDKGRGADKVKSYGTTRYERRHQQHIYNSISAFNKIDFNALFRANLLSFFIPVHGETNNYEVEVLFEGICDDIKSEIRANKYVLEYKCVYKALINAINRQDLMVACSCLHPETSISLLDGTEPSVEQLKTRFDQGEDLWVYSTDENGNFKPGHISNVFITKNTSSFIKVTLDNGEFILTTPDHLYMTRDGKYKHAYDLQVGESLMPMYFNESNRTIEQLNSMGQKLKANWEGQGRVNQIYNRINCVLQRILNNGEIPSPETYNKYKYHQNPKWENYFDTWQQLSEHFQLNHKILNIEYITTESEIPVYDISVDTWNNFRVSSGVILHNCPDWRYRQAYWANKQSYNGGAPEIRPSDLTNPNDTAGGGCKHVMKVLDNLDWAMKLSTSIFNYIKYMEENQKEKFVKVIFPTIFDIPYSKYADDNTLYAVGDQELANAVDSEEDRELVDTANELGEYNPEAEEPEEEEEPEA